MNEKLRYDIEEIGTGYQEYRAMVKRDDGDWISYEDYEALEKQVEELKALLKQADCPKCESGYIDQEIHHPNGTTERRKVSCSYCEQKSELLKVTND